MTPLANSNEALAAAEIGELGDNVRALALMEAQPSIIKREAETDREMYETILTRLTAELHTLRQRYARAGKHLRVTHLSERCKQLLRRAGAHPAD